jgi:hypothetical protein
LYIDSYYKPTKVTNYPNLRKQVDGIDFSYKKKYRYKMYLVLCVSRITFIRA